MSSDFDVLIIGAGLSGIGMACHLAMDCPDQRVGIIERRQRIGGTWDLFRYPGIRSDSDMCSFGFDFRPWRDSKVLADGTSIRNYVTDTAREYGVDQKIQFGLKLTRADWSSDAQQWDVELADEATGETCRVQTRFLVAATGYYNYDQGFLPTFPGQEEFQGQRIHPQFWPEDLDYSGKRVVIIGSGATAVTLVPSMADEAAHVTMLQRSPSYIFSIPAIDRTTTLLSRVLPKSLAFSLVRKRNITLQRMVYLSAKRWPDRVRKLLLERVQQQLPKGFDMRHFTPSYQPWDQRLCAVPSGDLFKAIRSGKASVATDQIERFTKTGIALKSGEHLDADIIVTATGLSLQMLGGAQLTVDGQARPLSAALSYKGTMVEGVPNLAFILGYTNSSWTLKADIASRYLCKLINHMQQHGYGSVTPQAPASERIDNETVMGSLDSGYVRRAESVLPRQGRSGPWRVQHNYGKDKKMLLEQAIDDGLLVFEYAPDHAKLRAAA